VPQVNATATTVLDLSSPTQPKLKCLKVDNLDFATSKTTVCIVYYTAAYPRERRGGGLERAPIHYVPFKTIVCLVAIDDGVLVP
jgi:hypothetical protein